MRPGRTTEPEPRTSADDISRTRPSRTLPALNRCLPRAAHALVGRAQVVGGHLHPENALALMADDVERLGRADGPGNGLTVTAALARDDGPHLCLLHFPRANPHRGERCRHA